jgi:UPF0271 protein
MHIDLNADLGEGCGSDEALLDLVSSANIACGWHAGGAALMRDCVRWALQKGVAIGAHPSFNDPENFGRSEMQLSAGEIYAGVLYQLGALDAITRVEGGRISHLKPHGALYNQAARDPDLADAIVAAVHAFDPAIMIFGLANSRLIEATRRAGLIAVEEVFADRGYCADGSLVPRSQPGALLDDEDIVMERTLGMIRNKHVRSIDGATVPLNAETICLHGDGPHALAFARRIRERLAAESIAVMAASREPQPMAARHA